MTLDHDELDSLFECVDELVSESLNEQTYTLLNGEEVKLGSRAHIADLERSIKDITRRRNAERRGTVARDNYARALARLKMQLNRAQVLAQKTNARLGIV